MQTESSPIPISPDFEDTMDICKTVLTIVFEGNTAKLSVPYGQGLNVVARVRTYISRQRKRLDELGRPRKYFRLCTKVEKDSMTEHVLFWKEISDSHVLNDIFDEVLAKQNG